MLAGLEYFLPLGSNSGFGGLSQGKKQLYEPGRKHTHNRKKMFPGGNLIQQLEMYVCVCNNLW